MHRTTFSPSALRGNVAELYDETAARHADDLALWIDGGRSCTHAELRDRSTRLAGGFEDLGLRPDDRLAIYLPNSVSFVETTLAGLRAGLPIVPLNPQLRADEVAYRLTDCDAAAVVTDPGGAETIERVGREHPIDPLVIVDEAGRDGDEPMTDAMDRVSLASIDGPPLTVERESDDVALQPYTSGTTGKPKGVLRSHRNMRAQSLMGFERSSIPPEEERFFSAMPLSHIAGFINRTWQPLVRGGSVYLAVEWRPERALELIERHDISKFGGVATMYVDLVSHRSFEEADLSSLREAMQGGSKLPGPIRDRFTEATGVQPFEAYGLTETGGGTHAGINATFGPRPGTVGQPLRATDCKVVDEDGREVAPGEIGELLVRGPHVMLGYYDRPEETAESFTPEGYFKTGDVVRRDEDNYYTVIDRKSDVIVTAGYNVYPAEVEDVLHEHPDVADVAVVGVPDERRNETVKAVVVPETEDVAAEEVKSFVRERIAPYKHPRIVEFVDRLPRTNNGKVQRYKLAEAAGD